MKICQSDEKIKFVTRNAYEVEENVSDFESSYNAL